MSRYRLTTTPPCPVLLVLLEYSLKGTAAVKIITGRDWSC